MSNTIHWIEIPTKNIERAATFYNTVLDIDMKVMEAMGMKTAFFRIQQKHKLEVA